MLALVRSGIGLSLVRDSIAMQESQREGLVIADRVGISCSLGFVCLSKMRDTPAVGVAWRALARAWRR